MDVTFECFLTIFMVVTVVAEKSFFERDLTFDDKVPEEIPSQELMSTPFSICAKSCHGKETCLSFVYSPSDEKCQFFSQVILTPRVGEPKVGNVMFKKKVSGGCTLPTIENGRVHRVIGHGEGSRAYIVCDDFFYQKLLYLECSGGVWTHLSEYCRQDDQPYTFSAYEIVTPGHCVTLLATIVPGSDKYAVNIKTIDGSEVFFTASFLLEEQIIERFSDIGGVKSETETTLSYWPLQQGQYTNMTICTEETLYRMYFDGEDMFTSDRRQSTNIAEKIRVIGFIVKSLYYSI